MLGDTEAAAWRATLASQDAAAWASTTSASWIPVAVLAANAVVAAAAVVSDLVEKHGLTAKHIADLTQAWRVIIGTA